MRERSKNQQKDLNDLRQEKNQLMKRNSENLKKAESEKQIALKKVESEKEFLKIELDQVTEDFQRLKKAKPSQSGEPVNGAIANSQKIARLRKSTNSKDGEAPPAKRSKIQPSNLDE